MKEIQSHNNKGKTEEGPLAYEDGGVRKSRGARASSTGAVVGKQGRAGRRRMQRTSTRKTMRRRTTTSTRTTRAPRESSAEISSRAPTKA